MFSRNYLRGFLEFVHELPAAILDFAARSNACFSRGDKNAQYSLFRPKPEDEMRSYDVFVINFPI